MSQPYNATQAEEIKEATDAFIELCAGWALTFFLPVYEFVITFDQEVAAVWARDKKVSFGSFLLISTRWCMVLLAVISSVPTSCKSGIVVGAVLELAGFTQVAVFSALRVSAIWGRNWLLFSLVFVLGFVPVVTNAFDMARGTYIVDEGACISESSLSDRTQNILSLSTRIAVIIADILVLVLTWVKTYNQVVHARRAGQTMSVSLCLLRDGTVYFIILLALNLLDILLHNTLDGIITSSLMTAIPPILVSRFMLNLRQIDSKNSTQTVGRFSNFSAPQFRAADSVFGNFGESLEHGASLLDEDEPRPDAIDEGLPANDASRSGDDEVPYEDSDGALREIEASASSIEVIADVRGTDGSIV